MTSAVSHTPASERLAYDYILFRADLSLEAVRQAPRLSSVTDASASSQAASALTTDSAAMVRRRRGDTLLPLVHEIVTDSWLARKITGMLLELDPSEVDWLCCSVASPSRERRIAQAIQLLGTSAAPAGPDTDVLVHVSSRPAQAQSLATSEAGQSLCSAADEGSAADELDQGSSLPEPSCCGSDGLEGDDYVDQDGARWTRQLVMPPTLPSLERGLSEVKLLFTARFGTFLDPVEDLRQDMLAILSDYTFFEPEELHDEFILDLPSDRRAALLQDLEDALELPLARTPSTLRLDTVGALFQFIRTRAGDPDGGPIGADAFFALERSSDDDEDSDAASDEEAWSGDEFLRCHGYRVDGDPDDDFNDLALDIYYERDVHANAARWDA